MKTMKEKRIYSSPIVERIKLDNEISLILESTPLEGPGELASSAPEYFNNDPFKTSVG